MPNNTPYGFRDMRDLASPITEQRIPEIDRAITETVNFHNEQMNRMLDFFVRRTTEYQLSFKAATGARLMPLDEHGRARKIRPGQRYPVAFPIQEAGLAEGATETTRALETVQDVMDITATMTIADRNWMADHILAALFATATWTFPDDRYDDLTIQPLANGDAITYAGKNGQAATADHNTGQAAAILDASNPFPGIYTRLSRPSANAGRVVSFIPTNLVDDVENLATFRGPTDPDIRAAQGDEELIGTLPDNVPGEVIGKTNKVWIVHWDRLPDDYILSTTTDGERPLGMREYPVAALQGFRRAGQRNDYPYFETQFKRSAGFGAWNRVGADVLRIGNGTYAVPANYTSPMP